MSWETLWREAFAIPSEVPGFVIAALALAGVFCLVLVPGAILLSFLSRKLSADIEARIGPNRAGPSGSFQPFADLFKLLQKASPETSRQERIWVLVQASALYASVAALPIGSMTLLLDADMSALVPFWLAIVAALGSVFLGFSERTVASWFSGLRQGAQALSGAFPALVCLISAGIQFGGFRWSRIAAAQGSGPLSWGLFSSPPFQALAFLVFGVSGFVLFSLPPMTPSVETGELSGGAGANLDGRRQILLRFSRFYALFLWSAIAALLFLGGSAIPQAIEQGLVSAGGGGAVAAQLLQMTTLLVKTFLLMFLSIWVARANPRARVEQVTDFSWRILSPLALIALIGTVLWSGGKALL